MNLQIEDGHYKAFLSYIKDRIYRSQYEALRAVNKELIDLYLDIGSSIYKKQEEFGWGKSIVENIASDLQKEFPGIKGFSSRNIWNMRNFYQFYKANEKLQPLVAEISWTKNLIIMQKCKDNDEQYFYLEMTKKFGWTKNVLIHQIENRSFEKHHLNQTNFSKTLPEKYKHQAKLAVKDEYTFDFIEMGEEHSENELERSLMNNIRKFLIELGGYYAFIGNQFRIEVDGMEFFIDLLLFHRKLRSLVAIELKIGDFKPEYAGKMQFYLSALDDKVKTEEENPSIGIIICRSKHRTIVEYTLKDLNKPMGVSTYKILTKLPEELSLYLPTKDDIVKSFQEIE